MNNGTCQVYNWSQLVAFEWLSVSKLGHDNIWKWLTPCLLAIIDLHQCVNIFDMAFSWTSSGNSLKILLTIQVNSLKVMPIFGKERLVYTVESHYNVVQFTMILHTTLRWQHPNVNETSNSQQHPIPRPDGQAMGCLLWGFGGKLTAL